MSRRRLARFAAPAAFLAALTLAVLLIRSGLQGGRPATTPTVTQAATTSPVRTTRRPRRTTTAATTGTTSAAAVYYTVQSGDTFGSIAARFGTSVQRLEALNPGTSSTALTVGQKIRVK